VRLDPLLLTADQVRRYRLPRIPIKESEKRKGAFEAAHGEGATELDALEAIHPGEVSRLIEAAVEVYREPARDARDEIEAAACQYRGEVTSVAADVHAQHADELSELRREFELMKAETTFHQNEISSVLAEIESQFGTRLRVHVDAINSATTDFHRRAAALWALMRDALEEAAPELDEWPEPFAANESDEQLYQSDRAYIEQIDFYKRHQNRPLARRRSGQKRGERE
jgi:hypothetical protein